MREYRGGRATGSLGGGGGGRTGTPGKRTRTESLPVQRRAATQAAPALGRALAADPDWVASAAAPGVEGGGGPLPHLDRIQASFGAHDVTGVQAFVGGSASDAAGAMGATAYATGNKVAFAREPDLHTAAHEAAHVVQQRAGVSLYGGVGREGDDYERQADRVADAVVRGESAERLLGTPAPGAAAAGAPQGHVQRNLDPNLMTAIGDLFQKKFIDGQTDKKEMAVIDQILRLQIDGSVETTRVVNFLFAELDSGKSEMLRQGLFARGGLAAQLAIDRTKRQIEYYTAMNDQGWVNWYTQTTPVAYQPYLLPNHNQPQLQQVNAVPAPVAPAPSNQLALTGFFQQNARKVPPGNGATKNYNAPGLWNQTLIVRKGHIQRRHMFETFDFSPENIYRYEYNNRVHSFFAPGTKVGALVAGLLQRVGTALAAAQSDPNQETFAGSSGGEWFSFRFDRNGQTVTLEQLYPQTGIAANTDDLKAIAKAQGWGSYNNHNEVQNPPNSRIFNQHSPYAINPVSRETFGPQRTIEHWDDSHGVRRYSEKRGQHNISGWREQNGQLENGSWGGHNVGIQWTPRHDDGQIYGRYDFNQQQTMYQGWRNNNGQNQFISPTQNPQPGDWRDLRRGQPNGSDQVEVVDPNNNDVEHGRRVNNDGTVDTWDPQQQQWYQDPGRQQQVQDYQLGELKVIDDPVNAPQGSAWLVWGYQTALPRYQQAQTDYRQALDGGNANPQSNNAERVYMAGWNHYSAGWNAAHANPDAAPPQDAREQGGFNAYVTLYDQAALVLGLAAAMGGNAHGGPGNPNPAYVTGWNEWIAGWTYAAQNPHALAPVPATRGGRAGFNAYRLLHPQPQQGGGDDDDDNPGPDDHDGDEDDKSKKRKRSESEGGKGKDPHSNSNLSNKMSKTVGQGIVT